MPISQFTIGASRTLNLGGFESMRIESSVTWDLNEIKPGALAEAEEAAQKQLRKQMEDTYRNMTAKGANLKEVKTA